MMFVQPTAQCDISLDLIVSYSTVLYSSSCNAKGPINSL